MIIPKPIEDLSEEERQRKAYIARVTTATLKTLTEFFLSKDFDWLLPVLLSPTTDPLWPDPNFSIEKRLEFEIYDKVVRLTQSMIVHKLASVSLLTPKLFVISPNIRIEKRERASTGIHLYEFNQLDFEVRDATSKDIRQLVEEALHFLLSKMKSEYKLTNISLPSSFKTKDREEIEKEFGKDYERKVAESYKEPIWVLNIPREFYDYEDFETGKWDNYDLILPGLGEVLSGSRREYEYDKIIKKMERDGVRKENYAILLKLAKEKRLKPSAGAGIGIERLIAWLVKAKHVAEVQPFPRVPGIVYEL